MKSEGILAHLLARCGLDLGDRYLSRVFWSSYAVCFLFFFGFFVVIDLFGKSDDFFDSMRKLQISQGELLRLVLAFYVYSGPAVFLQLAPFVTVIGTIVALARMQRSNELIPIIMSGRSVFRMLRPIFLYAGLLTVSMILVQELVAPVTAGRRITLEQYLREGERVFRLERPVEDGEGWLWSSMEYEPRTQTILQADVARVTKEGDTRVYELGTLRNAMFDRERGLWRIPQGMMLHVFRGELRDQNEVQVLHSTLLPEEIVARRKEAFDVSFLELGLLYASTGDDRYKVLLHYHVTFPLTNILLILLTAPFVLRFDRRSAVIGLAVAFLLCGAYFGIDFGMRTLGERHLHPVLAAWFAPIFFGALGISLFDGIRT